MVKLVMAITLGNLKPSSFRGSRDHWLGGKGVLPGDVTRRVARETSLYERKRNLSDSGGDNVGTLYLLRLYIVVRFVSRKQGHSHWWEQLNVRRKSFLWKKAKFLESWFNARDIKKFQRSYFTLFSRQNLIRHASLWERKKLGSWEIIAKRANMYLNPTKINFDLTWTQDLNNLDNALLGNPLWMSPQKVRCFLCCLVKTLPPSHLIEYDCPRSESTHMLVRYIVINRVCKGICYVL